MKKHAWNIFVCTLIALITALEIFAIAQLANEQLAAEIRSSETTVASINSLTQIILQEQPKTFIQSLFEKRAQIETMLSTVEAKSNIESSKNEALLKVCRLLRGGIDIAKAQQLGSDAADFSVAGNPEATIPTMKKTFIDLCSTILHLESEREERARSALVVWKNASQAAMFFAISIGLPLLLLTIPVSKSFAQILPLQELNRAQLEARSDAVVIVDSKGSLSDINPSAEQLFASLNITKDALVDLTGPESTLLQEALHRARQTGSPVKHESVYSHSQANLRLSWKLEWLPLNKMWICVVEKSSDESKQLPGYRSRLRAIFDKLQIAIVIFNENDMIESVNKCAVELLEFSAEELVDKSFTSIFCDQAQAKDGTQTFTNSLLKHSSDSPVEIMMRKKSGVEFPVEISLFLIGNDSQKQYLANILDVTHRHEMERVKRDFTAMITHDLKTPLTSIHLFLDMLSGEMYELPGSLSATAKNLSMSVTRAIDMINSILDIEKLEAGRLELSLDNVSINELLINAVSCVKPLADHRQVSILRNENITANVVVDEQRILQVLINLLSNAIKFSPAKSTVSISARLTDASVEVRVTDEGRGIAQEFCEKIFDRFEQVEIADARLKGGTGLGLSVCKALIELHGGTIGVHSEVGKGSTFWFSIPQRQEQIVLDEDRWVIPIVS